MRSDRSWPGLRGAAAAAALLLLAGACRPLQTARVRQEVTADVYGTGALGLGPDTRLVVLTLAREERTLSKTTRTANEAAADIVSLELLNRGFRVVDRSVVNDAASEQGVDLKAGDLSRVLALVRGLSADYLVLTNLFENLQASHAIQFLPGNVLTSIDTSANIGLSARVLDLESGRVVWAGMATTQDQNFQQAIHRIARRLIASMEGR